MRELRHIYYRGSLRSCNYACAYCPFAKRRSSKQALARDQQELARFVAAVAAWPYGPLSVQLLPYGEALIHEYYWQALAQLSRLPQVTAVGAQTNLSFSVPDMLALFRQQQGQVAKLRLWCTFHGQMTSEAAFLRQGQALAEAGVAYCVGVVGDPQELSAIASLRAQLSPEIYLWINRMDGLKRPYSAAEAAAFAAIDPYFPLEINEPLADAASCGGGREALFVRGDGACYSCNLNRERLGSFYDGWWTKPARCTVKRCHCYLAYCNRRDLPQLAFFDRHPGFRQPILPDWQPAETRRVRAVFFDLDGSLLDDSGQVRPALAQALPVLAEQYPLYLATLRPPHDALRLLGSYRQHFTGGVLAGGAVMQTSWQNEPQVMPLAGEQGADERLADWARRRHFDLRRYQAKGQPYRLALRQRGGRQVSEQQLSEVRQLLPEAWQAQAEGPVIGITSRGVDKLQAMERLAQAAGFALAETAYLGNAEEDVPIFAQVAISIAPADAQPAAQKAARYLLP